MFPELHAMAKDATLMITARAEGDQLRVSVTPTYPEGKAPAGVTPLRPLSVIGTPEELDADFASALTIWRAPKRSIIEQAQAAADEPEEIGAGKASRKPAEAKPKAPPARKPRAAAQPEETASPADPAVGADASGTGNTNCSAGEDSGHGSTDTASNGGDALPIAAPAETATTEPAAAAPLAQASGAAVDTFTIDLF